jgi:hypothetical protein
MLKILQRTVGLFLISSLLVDPIWASLANPSPLNRPTSARTPPFACQALSTMPLAFTTVRMGSDHLNFVEAGFPRLRSILGRPQVRRYYSRIILSFITIFAMAADLVTAITLWKNGYPLPQVVLQHIYQPWISGIGLVCTVGLIFFIVSAIRSLAKADRMVEDQNYSFDSWKDTSKTVMALARTGRFSAITILSLDAFKKGSYFPKFIHNEMSVALALIFAKARHADATRIILRLQRITVEGRIVPYLIILGLRPGEEAPDQIGTETPPSNPAANSENSEPQNRPFSNANADRLYAVGLRVPDHGPFDSAEAQSFFDTMQLSNRDRAIVRELYYTSDGRPVGPDRIHRIAMIFKNHWRAGDIRNLSFDEVVMNVRNAELDAEIGRATIDQSNAAQTLRDTEIRWVHAMGLAQMNRDIPHYQYQKRLAQQEVIEAQNNLRAAEEKLARLNARRRIGHNAHVFGREA